MSTQTPPGKERRLAAIISADIVGYSRRMAEDEQATVQTLQSHRETMRGCVREHHGRVVDAVGDNMMSEFQSAVDAVNCALEIQRVIAERNEPVPEEHRMPFRIGIHIGDLLVDGEQIFGDGINIAARIEAMAPPGGICVSGTVAEQVRGKVNSSFDDLGEHTLKNIPQLVHVWSLSAGQPDRNSASNMAVAGFGGRAAIAVMPFENRSGDPEQEFLADGIVEDVIAGLSAYRLFPVIARSSTFSYKGKHLDARQVGTELGARYVVDGSVRKAGNRIRVATELVDCQTGHQIQSERFEHEIGDLFELQDEIVTALIASLEPALGHAEARRVSNRPTASLSAWESLQKGHSLMIVGRQEDAINAEPCFRRAIELDPGFSAAYAALCILMWARVYFGWEPASQGALEEAYKTGMKALELDQENPRAHEAMGWMLWYSGDSAGAIRRFERAIEINPSLASAWWSLASMLSDKHPDEAMALAQKSVRLSPKDRFVTIAYHVCGLCAFLGGRFDEAVKWEQHSISHPAGPQSYRLLGAALGHVGQIDEAIEAMDEAMRQAPNFTLTLLRAGNSPKLVNLLLEGWRKAGWTPPE